LTSFGGFFISYFSFCFKIHPPFLFIGNAGVHVKPEMGSAVYFSYIDPDTLVTDNGFTEHSGCPVVKGEKKIVTQWIRRGVDDANPWDSFNTLGIKKSEANEAD
jgi:hypothetical protein